MKFEDVPIGAKYFSPNVYEFTKVDTLFAAFVDDHNRWHVLKIPLDSECELITKCENCQHYEKTCKASMNMISQTSQVIMGEKMYCVYSEHKDPSTFSCTEFKEKI